MLRKIIFLSLAILYAQGAQDTQLVNQDTQVSINQNSSKQDSKTILDLVTPVRPLQKIITGYLAQVWTEVPRPIEHVDWYMAALSEQPLLNLLRNQLDAITCYKPIQILITHYMGGGVGSSPPALSYDFTDGWPRKKQERGHKFYLTLDPMLDCSTANSECMAEYRDTGDESSVTIYDRTQPNEQILPVDKRLCALGFSPDGRYFAAAAQDNTVKIWERPSRLTKLL